MKKTLVTLLVIMVVVTIFTSCSSSKCDAYKTSHSYAKEIIR